MTTRWFIVKNGKSQRIDKPKSVDSLLQRGYTVSEVITEGNSTKINTFSPRTREEAYAEHKRLNQIGRF